MERKQEFVDKKTSLIDLGDFFILENWKFFKLFVLIDLEYIYKK
jgi:hypothetical protein